MRSLGIESARLEMELILAESLGFDRLRLYLNLQNPLPPAAREASRAMLARRREREPLAYILGRREFYGLPFRVTPAVLVPRPETELLVDRALMFLAARPEGSPDPLMLDLGTGSGAIAVAASYTMAARSMPGRWIATDISADALAVARENAAIPAPEIEFREGPLFEPVVESFDLICSNPPYIPEGDRASLAPEVAQWEPAGALFSGADGLDCIKPLLIGAVERLNPGGLLLVEIGHNQAPLLRDFIAGEPMLHRLAESMVFHLDHAGIERILELRVR